MLLWVIRFGLVQTFTFVSHDREFIYKPRGFDTVWDMNEAIVENWNKVVDKDDICYVLGDIMLNNNEIGLSLLRRLNGNIHIIAGNHDSYERIGRYVTETDNVLSVLWADMIRYKGYHFYLSHFPTMTGNLENESLKKMMCCLFGHTHQKTNFYNDIPYLYHVGVDSHNCAPVLLDDIIIEMNNKVKECISQL